MDMTDLCRVSWGADVALTDESSGPDTHDQEFAAVGRQGERERPAVPGLLVFAVPSAK